MGSAFTSQTAFSANATSRHTTHGFHPPGSWNGNLHIIRSSSRYCLARFCLRFPSENFLLSTCRLSLMRFWASLKKRRFLKTRRRRHFYLPSFFYFQNFSCVRRTRTFSTFISGATPRSTATSKTPICTRLRQHFAHLPCRACASEFHLTRALRRYRHQ